MTRALATVVAVLALAAGAASAAPPATVAPGQLTVGLSMPSEGFQVGVVKGSEVVYARGLEVDLANELTRRLELQGTTFVQSAFPKLLSAGTKPWDLAIAEVTITKARAKTVSFSVPYMKVDQGVLLSQFVRTKPRAIAALRGLKLCSLKGSTGSDVVDERIRPTRKPLRIGNVPTLMLDLQNGRCDAVVYDLPALATLKAQAPRRYGALAGLIRTDEEYGIVMPKGSPLKARVDLELRAMIDDGTISRLQQTWLAVDLDAVRVLA